MAKLEAVLRQHLQPVGAPGELWDRLQIPRDLHAPKPHRHSSWRLAWAGAAVVLAACSAVGLHTYLKKPAEPTMLQTAGRAPDTARFRTWVRSTTGLDIQVACRLCHDGEELLTAWN